MNNEEIKTTQHVDQSYRIGDRITDISLSSSSSSDKNESLTTSQHSISISYHNLNVLSSGQQQQPSVSTIPFH
jgi:hypothetical protein